MTASPKDATAEPAIARVARAVTQPGGRNIDWKKVRAAGAVIAGMSVILGVRHRRWRYTHTAGVVLGIAAAAAVRLKDKYAETPDSKLADAGLCDPIRPPACACAVTIKES